VDGITAFMIVRDEAALLPGCLDSLDGVVEALAVVDTGSRDATPSLVEAARARFREVRLVHGGLADGFGPARQWALDLVATPWALWLDADERLSPALRAELRSLGDDGARDAYRIPFRNHVLGRRMRCRQLSGQAPVRLLRTGAARIDGALVHERVAGPAPERIGRLRHPIDHLAMTDWRAYLRKVDRYTTLEAAASPRPFRLWHLLATGPATFLQQYLRRTAIIDGWPGLVWAATSAWSAVLRDWKLARRARRTL